MISQPLPGALKRYCRIGGVLEFKIYRDAVGDDAAALAAIVASLGDPGADPPARLCPGPINAQTFLGDWCDAGTITLIRRGHVRLGDGRELIDPKFRDLAGLEVKNASSVAPLPGEGGQFARAFAFPPYGLRARPEQVHALFREVVDVILPPGLEHRIFDWTTRDLAEAYPYFADGMEWWGIYLFTIQVPALERVMVIMGSATD